MPVPGGRNRGGAGRVVRCVCPHDCPDSCVTRVELEGHRVVAIGGDPDHPFTRGFLCTKVNRYLERVYNPELARRFPLAFISPPAHHFLNSTFSAQPVFVSREKEPSLTIHPADAAQRGIQDGQTVRTFNDRGSFPARARGWRSW